MENSILRSVKKTLGIEPNDTSFDLDVITHINSVFSNLAQIGPGPEDGFMIEDDTAMWDDFLIGDRLLNNVKTYVFLCVRLIWDPPATSFAITAMERQKDEMAWRIGVEWDRTHWRNPEPGVVSGMVLDGGSA